jgi:hypothetical protein
MYKISFLIAILASTSVLAVGPAPEYLKGGVITVTLKNGKTYTYSADEYAVVKRGQESKPLPLASKDSSEESVPAPQQAETKVEGHKNIISVGAVRSQRGLNVTENANSVEVSSKKQIGAQLQYQRRVTDKVYLGGQLDTNQGVGVNIGVGF